MQKIVSLRERIILFSAIGVIIFSIVFNFFIVPAAKKNDALNKEITITKAKLNKYTRLLAQKDYIQKKYKKFAAGGSSQSSVSNDTLVSILAELEAIAKKTDIVIIDIRPEGTREDLYKEILIDLRTEGSLVGYLKFIYNIENSLSLLRIKKFQISVKPNTKGLEGNFVISRFSTLE